MQTSRQTWNRETPPTTDEMKSERSALDDGDAPTALESFVSNKNDIDAMLARLAARSAEHFNVNPDDVTWGDVGSIRGVAYDLQAICDQTFNEGEFVR